jgi:hypothetical protein
MTKPKCPSCGEELFIQDQHFALSKAKELEMNDPSLPVPGERVREWGNELYHPHYYCDNCEGDFSFNLQPIPPFMLGRDDEDMWSLDDVQFVRLLAEICAASAVDLSQRIIRVDFRAVFDSMDIEPEEIVELLNRADRRWEQYKQEMRPAEERKKDKTKEIIHEEMRKALKTIDERLRSIGVNSTTATDNLADNIDDVVNEL